ncbi:MAG: hypothetical protein PHI12_15095 [Dehalococcoidales bacterium]|jgi:hypothetical protein|nr:hypothetical protein [Dehalococcoidales bacterium]
MPKVSKTGMSMSMYEMKALGCVGAVVLTALLWNSGWQKSASLAAGAAAVLGLDTYLGA